MSGFTLDTSGRVECIDPAKPCICYTATWDRLSPFAQGYIEAMMAAFRNGDIGHWPGTPHAKRVMRFDRLASETLATILRDCGAFSTAVKYGPPLGRLHGEHFWHRRQNRLPGYPPLTPYLDDDGKVRLLAADLPAQPHKDDNP